MFSEYAHHEARLEDDAPKIRELPSDHISPEGLGRTSPERPESSPSDFSLELRRELADKLSLGYVGTFSAEGLALVFSRPQRKWNFVDSNGRLLSSTGFDGGDAFHGGIAAVFVGHDYFFIDTTGQRCFGSTFEYADGLQGGVARVRSNGVWNYITSEGLELSRHGFDEAFRFTDGIGLVRSGASYHFIRKDGSELTPDHFQHAEQFDGGVARVQTTTESYYIDLDGRRIFV